MAMTPQVVERTGNAVDSFPITAEHELFATLIASGVSFRDAAKRCGFNKDYGWDLAQKPEVKARILALTDEPAENAKRSIRAELAILRNRAALHGGDETVRSEIQIRLQVLMAQAKFEGLIVERKQVSKVSASLRFRPEEVNAALQADLERLAPGAAGALERLGRPPMESDLKAIAAGELVESSLSNSPTKK